MKHPASHAGAPLPLLVFTGPPASGKSTLAAEIASQLSVPLIAKDPIKETLFEAFGSDDKEWSQLLGRGTYPLLYHFLSVQLAARQPCIIEGTFGAEFASGEFAAVRERHPFEALQIYCTASPDVLHERYTERAPSRHAGHAESAEWSLAQIGIALEEGRWQPLDLGGPTLMVDTTDFGRVDRELISAVCREHLSSG